MLIEKYREIFNKPEKWKYYKKPPFKDNPFDDKSVMDSFIDTYFNTGGKGNVLDKNISKVELRNIHSISTFFLGILLKPICIISEQELKPDFRYLWFITCLYHDYGYFYEKETNEYPPQEMDLSKLLLKLKIKKHNLLNSRFKSLHSIDTIKKYYEFCRKEYNFINHGIVGGLLLYDKLKKNFEENLKKALKKDPDLDRNDFYYKDLHWSGSHEDFYQVVAGAIISHNIWFANKNNDEDKDKIKKYEEENLNELIICSSDQRISCESDPFLFLLLLADTIEPIKFFDQYKYNCILEKLDIDINEEDEIVISVIDNCLEFKDWFKKIKDLEKWTKVSVKQDDDKILKIKLE